MQWISNSLLLCSLFYKLFLLIHVFGFPLSFSVETLPAGYSWVSRGNQLCWEGKKFLVSGSGLIIFKETRRIRCSLWNITISSSELVYLPDADDAFKDHQKVNNLMILSDFRWGHFGDFKNRNKSGWKSDIRWTLWAVHVI